MRECDTANSVEMRKNGFECLPGGNSGKVQSQQIWGSPLRSANQQLETSEPDPCGTDRRGAAFCAGQAARDAPLAEQARIVHQCPMTSPAPLSDPSRQQPKRGILIALILACVVPEIILLAADLTLIGSPRWRPLAYQYGAFWAGLLHGWQPNFAAQPVTMFLSHAFLHTGPVHLVGNMLALAVLGQIVLERRGPWAFAPVYLAAILGGGAAFGLLSRSAVPMVGASGAIFGLAGAALVWRCQDQTRSDQRRIRNLAELCGGLLGLVVINLLMWWIQDGQLAWQTHLGGTLAGALVAVFWPAQRPVLAKMRS